MLRHPSRSLHRLPQHARPNPADYPPEYDYGEQCEVCGKDVDFCVCPECPSCRVHGDPKCYREHGLALSVDQRISQTRAQIAALQQQIADHEYYLSSLEQAKYGRGR